MKAVLIMVSQPSNERQAIEWAEQQPGSKRGPLTSGAVDGRRGAHRCSHDTRMEMAFLRKQSLMENSPVLGLPLNWRLFTRPLLVPPCLPPPGRPRGCGTWGEGLDEAPGSLALCDASGEMASLHQLDDKTLLMAPIKKCECNFLLLVISSVFGILLNRSTGQSRSLLKPSLFMLEGS